MPVRTAKSRPRIHDAAIRLFAERGSNEIAMADLAAAAGLARGTIYNNVPDTGGLFVDVVNTVAHEMHARVAASMADIADPVTRLATGLRLFVRRAHEEPHWGKFIVRFAMGEDLLQTMMHEPPAADIARSIETGRFKVDRSQVRAVASILFGTALAAMHSVLCGHQAWREAGSSAAELFLRSAGVSATEAKKIARQDLPLL